MKQRIWLRLSGTRYRCIPLYIPVDEFDPLSRLFLEVLRYERNVPRLVRAFGLTERVVEDVLGDLIRRNRVTLVMQDGVKELRLVDDALPNIVHEPGETIDVWQDSATGLVLPALMMDPYDRPRGDDNESVDGEPELTIQSSVPLIDSFLHAPDAQLIEILIRADEDLRERDEVYGQLDRLADRYRVRPQTVWLPMVDAELQGRMIPLIATERLPGWVTRVWSVAVRRDGFLDPADEVGFHTAATTADEGNRVVHGWRTITKLESWRSAVDRFLRLVPAPISGYDLREVREREAELRGVFLSMGQIELLDEPRAEKNMDWLGPVFDTSRDWVVLVLPWVEQINHVLQWLQNRVEQGVELPSTFILVLPSATISDNLEASLHRIFDASRFACSVARAWPSFGPAVALGDGPEVRVQYAPRSMALKMSGQRLAADWLGIVQGLPKANPPTTLSDTHRDDPLRRLRIRSRAAASSANDSGQVDAHAVVDHLRDFGETLLTAIVDPESLIGDGDNDSMLPASIVTFDRQRSLLQQLPQLEDQCETICQSISLSPERPWASWTHLALHDLLPALVAVLTEPLRRSVAGEIHILATGVAEETRWPTVVDLIERAVLVHGWTIHVGLPKFDDLAVKDAVINILSSVRARVASPRLRLWAMPRSCPAHALVIGDLVFLAGGDWLRSVLQHHPDGTDFGFAVESRDFAQSLRDCFAGAEEVSRYQANI